MSRWPITPDEAADALRRAAERLACEPDGLLVCRADQFLAPPRPPHQEEVERWICQQGYRLTH